MRHKLFVTNSRSDTSFIILKGQFNTVYMSQNLI